MEEDEQEESALDLVAQLRKKEREEGMVRSRGWVWGEGGQRMRKRARPASSLSTSVVAHLSRAPVQDVDEPEGAEEDAHADLSIPSQQEIEKMLLEKRKQVRGPSPVTPCPPFCLFLSMAETLPALKHISFFFHADAAPAIRERRIARGGGAGQGPGGEKVT